MYKRNVQFQLLVSDDNRVIFTVQEHEPDANGQMIVRDIMDMSWNGCTHYDRTTRSEFVMAAISQMCSIMNGQFLEVQCPEVEDTDLTIRTLWEEDTSLVR